MLSWPRDLSKTHWPKGSNLPNQTNHLICRQNQKMNPSTIPLVLSRNNQTKSKSKSNENQKTNPWKDSVSVFWFKLCSRRLTERNAAILSSYIIRRRTGRSLAIIRSVSLRLQNEGQKKAHGLSQMHTESLTRIFLTFVFWFISGFHTDLQA